MSRPAHPTLVDLPPSQPDTPSEMPGTPTSTTTSLSALSTTAIKDGQRGHANGPHHRGHHHNLSTNSLEAERADRISRMTGFGGVAALRGAPPGFVSNPNAPNYLAHQQPPHFPANQGQYPPGGPTPPAAGFPTLGSLTPAYFDAAGQPFAATKMSTVGSASATDSVAGRSRTSPTETGDGSRGRFDDDDDDDDDDEVTHRHHRGDDDDDDDDDDQRSMDTNQRETEIDMDSASGYMNGDGGDRDGDGDGDAVMDDDMLATRSIGGFDMDRMSDDGSASLVGFGEGAGSTVSGPIYHRRPLPPQPPGGIVWGLERSSSGLSEPQGRRDTIPRSLERDGSSLSLGASVGAGGGGGGETPVSQSAVQERREALMVDGIALDGANTTAIAIPADDDVFVDTAARGPVPVVPVPVQATMSAIRETQQPHSHQHQFQQYQQYQQQQQQQQAQARQLLNSNNSSSSRAEAERIVRERLDNGEARVGSSRDVMGSPHGSEPLGRFYFEERR